MPVLLLCFGLLSVDHDGVLVRGRARILVNLVMGVLFRLMIRRGSAVKGVHSLLDIHGGWMEVHGA